MVALNLLPQKAILADTNKHIINLYRSIQSGAITATSVREHLVTEGAILEKHGADHYMEIRKRFNSDFQPLDFLFLNRSCFNGVMRFNRKGLFNVPFCHKPNRFCQAYVTKIVNQVRNFHEISSKLDWQFVEADFRETLSSAEQNDIVYADPPYLGRHVDYFNSWGEEEDNALATLLKSLPCKFVLSTWHGNRHRDNATIQEHWGASDFRLHTIEHFYHVGATEDLRSSMTEAVITNFGNGGSHTPRNKSTQAQFELLMA